MDQSRNADVGMTLTSWLIAWINSGAKESNIIDGDCLQIFKLKLKLKDAQASVTKTKM